MSPCLRILVVDDDSASRLDLAAKLREQRHRVTEAPDAIDGIGKLASFKPHLVFCGVRIPYRSGVELLGDARRAGCKAAFVMMAASCGEAVDASRFVSAGDVLVKPLDTAAISVALERAQSDRRLCRHTARPPRRRSTPAARRPPP